VPFIPGKNPEAHQAKRALRASAKAFQDLNASVVDGYTLKPAIGRTGGVNNIGWELHPPARQGSVWYLSTKQGCIDSIPRHRALYG